MRTSYRCGPYNLIERSSLIAAIRLDAPGGLQPGWWRSRPTRLDAAIRPSPSKADAVPAYLPESLLPDPPSLTGPPCPLNDRTSQTSCQPSMVAGNSRLGCGIRATSARLIG